MEHPTIDKNLGKTTASAGCGKRKYQFMTAEPCLYGILKGFAKENRKKQTEAESFLWSHLRVSLLGVKFNRQHIISNYIADFVCLEARIIIEVDGAYHAQYEQQCRDSHRTEKLQELGFTVLRYDNNEIIGNIDNILEDISSYVRHITK